MAKQKMKEKYVTPYVSFAYKQKYHVDFDLVDTEAKEIVSTRILGWFKTPKEANKFAEREAKKRNARFIMWEERKQIVIDYDRVN